MPFLDLTDALVPDPASTTGPYWQPSAILDANDLHDGIQVLAFPDGSTKIFASTRFRFPSDYGSSGQWVIRWKTTATTGNVVWDVDYNALAVGESADPSSYTQSQTVTSGADATARDIVEATITPTDSNFAAGDTVFVSVGRDLADGSDTMAATAELIEFGFNYTAA
jgi:hypothetical protein